MSDAPRDTPADSDGPGHDVDWTIDLEASPPEQRSDPRLELVAQVLREAHVQLASITSTVRTMETVIRGCAEEGMTVDEISVQASLGREAVERVLGGGTLFPITGPSRLD